MAEFLDAVKGVPEHVSSFFKKEKKKYDSMTNQELSKRKFIASLILLLIAGFVVGVFAQYVFKVFYGKFASSLDDWASMLLPLFTIILFFLVYVLALAAYVCVAFLVKVAIMRRNEDTSPWQTCFMWGVVMVIVTAVLGFFGLLPF